MPTVPEPHSMSGHLVLPDASRPWVFSVPISSSVPAPNAVPQTWSLVCAVHAVFGWPPARSDCPALLGSWIGAVSVPWLVGALSALVGAPPEDEPPEVGPP